MRPDSLGRHTCPTHTAAITTPPSPNALLSPRPQSCLPTCPTCTLRRIYHGSETYVCTDEPSKAWLEHPDPAIRKLVQEFGNRQAKVIRTMIAA